MPSGQAFDSVSGKFLAKTGAVNAVRGRHGSGLLCAPSDGGFTVPAGTIDHGDGPHTILALIERIADVGAGDDEENHIIIGVSGSGFALWVDNVFGSSDTNAIVYQGNSTIDGPVTPLNRPVVVGVKDDGTTATILFDGEDDASGARNKNSNTTEFYFMNRLGHVALACDKVRLYGLYIWRRVLEPSEVQFLSRVDFFAPVRPARRSVGSVAAAELPILVTAPYRAVA